MMYKRYPILLFLAKRNFSTPSLLQPIMSDPIDPAFFIVSKRLYISHLLHTSDAHLEFMVALYNTPEFIASFGSGKCTTVEDARSTITGRFRNEHVRNGYGQYLISLKPRTEASLAESTPVGIVALSTSPRLHLLFLLMAYFKDSSAWGAAKLL